MEVLTALHEFLKLTLERPHLVIYLTAMGVVAFALYVILQAVKSPKKK